MFDLKSFAFSLARQNGDRLSAFFAVCACLALGSAQAAEPATPRLAAEAERIAFSQLTPLAPEDLAGERGAANPVTVSLGTVSLNDSRSQASVSQTALSDVATGAIADNSFTDIGGMNAFLFNTGNNVVFQNTYQVNVHLYTD